MRVLVAVLFLVGIVGCGGDDNSPDDAAVPSLPVKAENADAGAAKTKPVNSEDVSQAEPKDLAQERTETPTDVPSDSSSDEAVAALKKLGARIKQDDQGNVVELNLSRSKITDAGLVHLKGLTGLQTLDLGGTEVTDAGFADLKKALPNCKIYEL